MFGEHHDIPHEFPEYKEVIPQLCEQDHDFQQLYQQYHDVDEEVLQIEQNLKPVSDTYAEDLKKQRVHLKDQIYARLREHTA